MCLSVCVFHSITRKSCGRSLPFFCGCGLWHLFGPPPAALRYVMYLQFYVWRHNFIQWDLWAWRAVLARRRQWMWPMAGCCSTYTRCTAAGYFVGCACDVARGHRATSAIYDCLVIISGTTGIIFYRLLNTVKQLACCAVLVALEGLVMKF